MLLSVKLIPIALFALAVVFGFCYYNDAEQKDFLVFSSFFTGAFVSWIAFLIFIFL